jgi:SNF2 family DNA or RNA helicase
MKTLAEHQRYAVNMMDGNEALAIFYEAGTGKTALALTYIKEALMRGDIHNALVVCPAPLVPNWRASIKGMVDFGFSEGEIRVMERIITVISISSVWKPRIKTTRHRDGTVSNKRHYVINPVIDHPWDCIIVDESHTLGDPSSVQTTVMLKLAPFAKRRYIMTGTPDVGSGVPAYTKLYGQFKFLQPDAWGSFGEWKSKYVTDYNRFGKPIAYRVRECEDLKRRFGIVARLKDCIDLPEATETVMECPLAEPTVYKDILKGRTKKYDLFLSASGVASTKLLQICSGSLITDKEVRRLKTSKLAALLSILDGTDDKVVIFCNFSASIDMVAEALEKARITYLRYDGTTKEPLYRQFQEDPDIRVFLSQYSKGGTGCDLYASHTCVYYEPTRVALHLEQSKARILRTGQTKHCRYIYLVTPGTVEEKALESVRNGVSVSDQMLDAWAEQEREG